MKSIQLEKTHEKLGAKMAPFAGYNMPIQYEGITAEHKQVREKTGIFDVSHMGEFWVTGSQAKAFLQRVTTNNIDKLSPGKAQYTCMPNREGGIVDDLLVYCLSENEYMLVVNASNIQKDWDWLTINNDEGATMLDASDDYSLFAIQGPDTSKALKNLTDIDLEGMKMFTFEQTTFAGADNVIVSATGYTGEAGFEIYVKNKDAQKVWDHIMEAGKEFDIKPIGLGARDTLRLEAGLCLYGNDLDDTTSPIEANLSWITKFDTGFINAEALRKQKEEGPVRKLVGFVMQDRGIPRKDYTIKSEGGEEIGRVTSGTQSPTTKKSIGMGYVKTEYAKPGTEIFISVRNKMLKAEVVKPPFK